MFYLVVHGCRRVFAHTTPIIFQGRATQHIFRPFWMECEILERKNFFLVLVCTIFPNLSVRNLIVTHL